MVVGFPPYSEKIMSAQDADEAKVAQEQEVVPLAEELAEELPPTPPPVLEEDE